MTAILPVAQRGETILTLMAAPIAESELDSAWLHQLSHVLYATMMQRNGVGIAAPQVYISKRMIIVASRANPRYPDAPDMDAVVMVNPEIVFMSNETALGEEGCLSVPDTRGEVVRAETIIVRYLTVAGKPCEQTYHGFAARIVQHEVDHLDGVLFVDRIA